MIEKHRIDAIYWNHNYEPDRLTQDDNLAGTLSDLNIQIKRFNASLLINLDKIKTKSGDPYKVFTPFWREALTTIPEKPYGSVNRMAKPIDEPSEPLDSWALLPHSPNWAAGFEPIWQPGEQGAIKQLNYFMENGIHGYKQNRNIPALKATSRLSPHLHFGEISPYAIWRTVQPAKSSGEWPESDLETFLSELGWREFSYYLLYHFPDLPTKNFNPLFNAFPWEKKPKALLAWQRGLTGYPIVDAGMRELWHTGYMHNRVRMIVASFLTKDLLIDWRLGAEWFSHTLLDADLASNSASWQWVAGSGADAAPYFRVFNPVLQSEKFDPDGGYIKTWIHELREAPLKYMHKPWEASPEDRYKYGMAEYPLPIINHSKARDKALSIYKNLKK